MMTQAQEDKLKLHDNKMAIEALEEALTNLKYVEDEVIEAGAYDGKVDDILLKIENLEIDINAEIKSIERMGVNY
jgi:uncharacterized linocin/CFP29 family protein